MNRMLMSFLPLLAVACAGAQAPALANTVTETSKVARFVAGPGDRPQGALLRNGTFVIFSPGLAQRLPATLSKSAPLQVIGDGFSYEGGKTIQARSVTIAGVSYNDDGPMPGNPDVGPGPGAEPHAVPPPPLPSVPPPPPPSSATLPPPPPRGALPAGVPGPAHVPPPPDGATPPPQPPAPANNPPPVPESPVAVPPAVAPSVM